MKLLLLLPILVPLATAVAMLLAWRRVRLQRALNVAGAAALLLVSLALLAFIRRDGIQAVQLGNWPAPFGITFVADLLSAMLVVLAGVLGLAVAVYSLFSLDVRREAFGYYPLLHLLLMGVSGAFLTGDLFNLYVWFEVMLIASFVLLTLGGTRAQLEGAVKYVTLNLLSSAIFLAATGLLYGVSGTLNMADLARQLPQAAHPGLTTTIALLFLIAFGIKAAVFPLFFWLPASYHTPPIAITTIFSGLLTKVGVYAMLRVFTLIFVQDAAFTHNLILVLAGLTMVTGVLGAAAQMDFRRLLSFHIVSQIGYALMGLGLFSRLALAAAIFFTVHVSLAKAALFLASGIVHRLQGSYDLKKLGGLWQPAPVLSVLFLLPALSLAGLPPLSGFWAKFALVRAGLESSQYVIVATALAVSVLTLFSMTKIWAEVFWKPQPANEAAVVAMQPTSTSPNISFGLLLPLAWLAALTVVMGLLAEPFFALASQAAEQLLNPSGYINAVLEGGR
jgi:multicomponent Na+:H+ antiporter subunit D